MFFHIDCWRFKFLTQNSSLKIPYPFSFSPRTVFDRKRACRNDHFMKISIKWKNLSVKSNPCWCWFAFSWWINWMLFKLLTWQNFTTDSRLNQRSPTLLMTLWRLLQIKKRTGERLSPWITDLVFTNIHINRIANIKVMRFRKIFSSRIWGKCIPW